MSKAESFLSVSLLARVLPQGFENNGVELSWQCRRAVHRPAPLSGYLRNNPASPVSSAAAWAAVAQGLLGEGKEEEEFAEHRKKVK